MEPSSSSLHRRHPPFHCFYFASPPALAMDDPMPDRRQENRRLPHPSQYRRPPKIAKQRCKTEPDIDHFMLRGNFFSGLDKDKKWLPCERESEKISEASHGPNSDSWTRPRAKSAILIHNRQPSSPIIFRPTALARTQPPSSHFMPAFTGDYSNMKCCSRFTSDTSDASGPPWKERWEELLQDGQSRQASSCSNSSGCLAAHFRGRTFTVEADETGNNAGVPTCYACHKRSSSLPSRRLRLASDPEPASRTHSQGCFEPHGRLLPCLHPLSHTPNQSKNINALTSLCRRVGVTSIPPYPEELAAELFPPLRDQPDERTLNYGKSCLENNPQAHCFAAVPHSGVAKVSPHALGQEEARGRRRSINDIEFRNGGLDDTGSVIHTPFSGSTRVFELDAQVVRDLESYVNRSNDGDILDTPFPSRYHYANPPYPELMEAISFPHLTPEASLDGDAYLHLAPHNTPSSSVVDGGSCSINLSGSDASHTSLSLESLLKALSL